MRVFCFYLFMLTLFACESNTHNATEGKGNLDASVENEKAAELSQKPIGEDAEKFKGEYRDQANERVTTSIRDYPGKPGLLAFTLKIGSREPGIVGFWYDETQDALTSKKAEEQRNFSTLQLDETVNKLIEVHYDWKNNTTDTTIYIRTE